MALNRLISSISLLLIIHNFSFSQLSFYKSYNSNFVRPYNLVISKDNKFAYVATETEIQTYSKNNLSGELQYISSITNMLDGITQIRDVYSITISNSSNYLYFSSRDKIGVCKRDLNTGELTLIHDIDDSHPSSNITNNCITISNDDRFLYSAVRQNLYIYEINETTGFLSRIDAMFDLNDVEAMSFDISCEISPDNRYLYVTGGHGITVFKRNFLTGLLEIKQEIKGDNFINQGLTYAIESKAVAGNKFIYTVTNSMGSGALVVLKRDELSDSLTIIQTHQFEFGISGFVNPSSITILPNNKALSVNSESNMAFFEVDSFSGNVRLVDIMNSSFNSNLSMGGRKTFDFENRFLYNCPAFTDSIFIYKLNVFLEDNINICSGDSAILRPFNSYKTYNWSTGSNDSILKVVEGGIYWLNATDFSGNSDYDTIHVKMNELPNIDLGPDTILHKNQSIFLSPGFEFQKYSWYIDDSQDIISQDSYFYVENGAAHNHETQQQISVKVTDFKGCSGSDKINVLLLSYVAGANEFDLMEFKVFPNPANDYIFIENSAAKVERMKYYIYSINGSHFYNGSLENGSKINISSFPIGTYIIRFDSANQSFIGRFVKQ